MTQISRTQWDALALTQARRFEQRLVAYLEHHFGGDAQAAHHRSPREIATAALPFARQIGAEREADIAHAAILLAAVNRLGVPADGIRHVRGLLAQPGKNVGRRLADAAAYLGIA
jgi:hypothetical protein